MVINTKTIGILAGLLLIGFVASTNVSYGQVEIQTNSTNCDEIQDVIDNIIEEEGDNVEVQVDKSIAQSCSNLETNGQN